MRVPASFWRGGSSRGLLFHAKDLAPYSQHERENIIYAAMGTPDPDARQIDGLGGGVSSLSKVAIISRPGDTFPNSSFPGVSYAEDGKRDGKSWQLIYRFGQVAVKERDIDWNATCGNMAAAAASAALSWSFLPPEVLENSKLQAERISPVTFNILAAGSGEVFTATVQTKNGRLWIPREDEKGTVSIAGVPGRAAPVELRFPLLNSPLPSGSPIDTVQVDGQSYQISIVTAGLPNIYITPESLGYPTSLLQKSATDLDSDTGLNNKLEAIRLAAARHASLTISAASPKIILIGPPQSYTTSGGLQIEAHETDLTVRAISSRNFHRTIPGTTLSALNVARSIQGTLISQIASDKSNSSKVPIRVGHPAGVADSMVEIKDGKASSVLIVRTAREIMSGFVHL